MSDIRRFPKQAIIVTDKATYHITIEPFKNRDTGIVEDYSVNIGARNAKCLHMTIPGIETNKTEGTLNWISKITPECYLTSKDNVQLSQHIVNLALTIARDINPKCTRYQLYDASSFPCSLPNGKTYETPMKAFHIAFHGSTWYEYYFGARMVHNHETYVRLKLNLYDSAKKPSTFSFRNPDLDEILKPLFDTTKTWWEFFQIIQSKFGNKKCSYIYPWITHALYEVFDHTTIYETPTWYIDLTENEKMCKTPLIVFRTYEDLKGGGSRTRRAKKFSVKVSPVFKQNYYEIQSLKFW